MASANLGESLLSSLADSDAQVVPSLRVSIERGVDRQLTTSIDEFVRERERDINALCSRHYGEFFDSVQSSLGLKSSLSDLQRRVATLEGEMLLQVAEAQQVVSAHETLRSEEVGLHLAAEIVCESVGVMELVRRAEAEAGSGSIMQSLATLADARKATGVLRGADVDDGSARARLCERLDGMLRPVAATLQRVSDDRFRAQHDLVRSRAEAIGAYVLARCAAPRIQLPASTTNGPGSDLMVQGMVNEWMRAVFEFFKAHSALGLGTQAIDQYRSIRAKALNSIIRQPFGAAGGASLLSQMGRHAHETIAFAMLEYEVARAILQRAPDWWPRRTLARTIDGGARGGSSGGDRGALFSSLELQEMWAPLATHVCDGLAAHLDDDESEAHDPLLFLSAKTLALQFGQTMHLIEHDVHILGCSGSVLAASKNAHFDTLARPSRAEQQSTISATRDFAFWPAIASGLCESVARFDELTLHRGLEAIHHLFQANSETTVQRHVLTEDDISEAVSLGLPVPVLESSGGRTTTCGWSSSVFTICQEVRGMVDLSLEFRRGLRYTPVSPDMDTGDKYSSPGDDTTGGGAGDHGEEQEPYDLVEKSLALCLRWIDAQFDGGTGRWVLPTAG